MTNGDLDFIFEPVPLEQIPKMPPMPYEISLEERARELARRDLIVQRAMSIIGINNTPHTERKKPTRPNEDTEKA